MGGGKGPQEFKNGLVKEVAFARSAEDRAEMRGRALRGQGIDSPGKGAVVGACKCGGSSEKVCSARKDQ